MPEHPEFTESSDELYEDAPCGYVSYLEADGMIVRINRTLADWLGVKPEAVVGKRRFQELLTLPARMLHEARHKVMLRLSGQAGGTALEMLRADGTRLPVLVTSRLRRNAEGGAPWVRTSVFDATTYQRYERELWTAREEAEQAAAEARRARALADAASEAKSRFLSAMNHEFRSPIHVIMGYAELLTTPGLALNEETRTEYLTELSGAARHLVWLLEDATRYGRLDALGRAPAPRTRRLRELLQGGVGIASELLSGRAVTLHLPDDPEDPVVAANEAAAEAVGGVIRDIAQRAVAGTTLLVGIEAHDGAGTITFGGSALSQSEQALHALLAPLEAPEVLHRGLEGAGLGMAFAERVLRLAGGSIRLRAEPTGESVICLHFAAPDLPANPSGEA